MDINVQCQFSFTIKGKPIELEGSYVPPAKEGDPAGVSVQIPEASLAALREEPLGSLGEISHGFADALGLGSGDDLLGQITEQLHKVKPLGDAIDMFEKLELFLTDLKFVSGKSFTIGIKLDAQEAIPPLLNTIQVVSFGLTLTVGLEKKE